MTNARQKGRLELPAEPLRNLTKSSMKDNLAKAAYCTASSVEEESRGRHVSDLCINGANKNLTGGRQAARIALVTGASRGLGSEVAQSLAASGAHVVLVARSGERLDEVQSRIIASGGQATVQAVDLTQAWAADALASMLYKTWGRLDILIANAAVLGSIEELRHVTDATWLTT